MPITDWPSEDRPREKLFKKGEKQLTDTELLAILIKCGTKSQTALDIAKDLLQTVGNLKKLSQTPQQELLKIRGVGQATYAILKAAIELGRRSLNEPLHLGRPLNNCQVVKQFIAGQLNGQINEVFACLYLDNRLRPLGFEEVCQGTIHSANIYPREIIRRCLAHNAAKIILAHNHPSGDATPSQADKAVTQLLTQALHYFDIEVIDHIIIGHIKHFSFAEAGIMPTSFLDV